MNKLYIVTLYNHSYNFKQRYALTAQHEDAADTSALVQAGEGWKVDYSEFVCLTPETICKEV